MGYDLNIDGLWDSLIEFETSTQENIKEHIAIHEAGHMVAFRNLMETKTTYGWMEGNEGFYPCVIMPKDIVVSPVQDLAISMAGDVCSMIQENFEVPSMCLAMYRYYHPMQDSDWDTVRELISSEEFLMEFSETLENTLRKCWKEVINEYHVADLFFNMFDRIPQIVELIDRNDRPVLEKLFGVKRSYKYIKKKLLNPETAFEFCKCPNMVK